MISFKENFVANSEWVAEKPAQWINMLFVACLSLGGVFLISDSVFGQSTEALSALPIENASQSIFINDPAIGKDPFFPNSKRRANMIPIIAPVQTVTNSAEKNDLYFQLFSLKGISLSANKKLALINRITFAEGEEQEVRVADQVLRVRCVVIHERSAVISIKGREKELTLREGL